MIIVGYYDKVLANLNKPNRSKRRGKLTTGVLRLHDNAPVNISPVAQVTLRGCGFEQLPHLPYSLTMAPGDHYLFTNFKSHLRGNSDANENEVRCAKKEYLDLVSFYKFWYTGNMT